MALIESWMPPTRENYDFILKLWTFYPIVSLLARASLICIPLTI